MKQFNMIDEDFLCINCGKKIKKLGYSARNHCNYCLCSLHVDNNPGDRSANCGGILKPIGIEGKKKEKYKIKFKCDKCGVIKYNVSADDDDFELILELMSRVI